MSQTGASAEHPSLAHEATSQTFATHARPSPQGRKSFTPREAQFSSEVQQTAGLGLEQANAKAPKWLAIASVNQYSRER